MATDYEQMRPGDRVRAWMRANLAGGRRMARPDVLTALVQLGVSVATIDRIAEEDTHIIRTWSGKRSYWSWED
jgi:hypothetical protein